MLLVDRQRESAGRVAAARLGCGTNGPQDRVTLPAAGDLPLKVAVSARPDMVGVDRLLDAVAANRLRNPRRGRP